MSGRSIDLSDLTWDELGELTRPGTPDKVRGQVMREMGSRPEALDPAALRQRPTASRLEQMLSVTDEHLEDALREAHRRRNEAIDDIRLIEAERLDRRKGAP